MRGGRAPPAGFPPAALFQVKMDYNFHWRPVLRALPDLAEAGWVTMQVAVMSMLLGVVLGLALALARMSGGKILGGAALGWVELARNTPSLFQLYFAAFGLGAFGIHLSPFMAVLCALSFNNAGYLAETFRGGFGAVPPAQVRAARSLGMTAGQSLFHIVIPQVFRIVYHPMTNQFIWAILMSSLGMLVGMRELSGETQFLSSKTFRIFEFFAATAVVYYIIAKIVLGGARLCAWRLFRY